MFETGFVYMFPIIFIEMLWESKNKKWLINIPNAMVNIAV